MLHSVSIGSVMTALPLFVCYEHSHSCDKSIHIYMNQSLDSYLTCCWLMTWHQNVVVEWQVELVLFEFLYKIHYVVHNTLLRNRSIIFHNGSGMCHVKPIQLCSDLAG